MPATVYIEVDDRQVLDAIKALSGRLADMTPAMVQIAGRLAAGIEPAFDLEADQRQAHRGSGCRLRAPP